MQRVCCFVCANIVQRRDGRLIKSCRLSLDGDCTDFVTKINSLSFVLRHFFLPLFFMIPQWLFIFHRLLSPFPGVSCAEKEIQHQSRCISWLTQRGPYYDVTVPLSSPRWKVTIMKLCQSYANVVYYDVIAAVVASHLPMLYLCWLSF